MADVKFIGGDLKAWKDSIKMLSSRTAIRAIATEVLTQCARDIIKDLKANSPVGEPDYKIHPNVGDSPGELREAWDKDNVTLQIVKTPVGYAVTVKNTTPQASWVNYGRRQTHPGRYVWHIGRRLRRAYIPGTYFMERTADEFSFKMDETAQSKVEAWLRTVFDT